MWLGKSWPQKRCRFDGFPLSHTYAYQTTNEIFYAPDRTTNQSQRSEAMGVEAKVNTRKRTGANKREQTERHGETAPPDVNKVQSPQAANVYWKGKSAYELTNGMVLRATPAADLAARHRILDICRENSRVFAERRLTPALVAGIVPIMDELQAIVSMSDAEEQLDAQASPDELVVAAAARFASARRK